MQEFGDQADTKDQAKVLLFCLGFFFKCRCIFFSVTSPALFQAACMGSQSTPPACLARARDCVVENRPSEEELYVESVRHHPAKSMCPGCPERRPLHLVHISYCQTPGTFQRGLSWSRTWAAFAFETPAPACLRGNAEYLLLRFARARARSV